MTQYYHRDLIETFKNLAQKATTSILIYNVFIILGWSFHIIIYSCHATLFKKFNNLVKNPSKQY